jgi:hypothetical protein
MSLSLHNLANRFKRDLGNILGNELLNSGTVKVHWDSSDGPTDRNVESTYPDPVAEEQDLPALIHYVSVRTVVREFGEFQAGDAIVTFDPGFDFAGKKALWFELPDGKQYVQQMEGKRVMEFWDVVLGGVPATKTLLLRVR